MKRFEVTRIFYEQDYEDSKDKGQWFDVNEKLPDKNAGIFKVRLINSNEVKAFFYEDKASWIQKYTNDKCSYWWDFFNKNPLHDVTHWKENTV